MPLSGVGSSSGKESNSDACLFKARAFRGLIMESKGSFEEFFRTSRNKNILNSLEAFTPYCPSAQKITSDVRLSNKHYFPRNA